MVLQHLYGFTNVIDNALTVACYDNSQGSCNTQAKLYRNVSSRQIIEDYEIGLDSISQSNGSRLARSKLFT